MTMAASPAQQAIDADRIRSRASAVKADKDVSFTGAPPPQGST